MGNGRKPDPATPRGGRRPSGRKPLFWGKNPDWVKSLVRLTVPQEKATANCVPAAAVIRRWRALPGITGRKGCVGGWVSRRLKPGA